jgi:hypothetical protein
MGDLVAEVQAPTTVRFADGDAHASGGTFGQAPLPLARFYVIEARDMDNNCWLAVEDALRGRLCD